MIRMLIKSQVSKKVRLVKMHLQDYTGGFFSQAVYWQFLPKSWLNNYALKSIKDSFLYQSTIKPVSFPKSSLPFLNNSLIQYAKKFKS